MLTVEARISSLSGMEKLERDTVFSTGTHPAALPEGKTEEEALAVYENYNFNYEYNSALSITRYRQEVSLSSKHLLIMIKNSENRSKRMPGYFFTFAKEGARAEWNIFVT